MSYRRPLTAISLLAYLFAQVAASLHDHRAHLAADAHDHDAGRTSRATEDVGDIALGHDGWGYEAGESDDDCTICQFMARSSLSVAMVSFEPFCYWLEDVVLPHLPAAESDRLYLPHSRGPPSFEG